MKKSVILGAFLLSGAFFFAPADTAQAKEVTAGADIPLTSEYFPDEWLLNKAVLYDNNKDGYLSPEEVAEVTEIWCKEDVTDFSQIQYFTNLKRLQFGVDDEYDWYGVWVGGDLDLTVFPDLESFWMWMDSSKAPSKTQTIKIDLSGLQQLSSVTILDRGLWSEDYDTARLRISSVDLRDTPRLDTVDIDDVMQIHMDETSAVSSLSLWDVGMIPDRAISGCTKLERLSIRTYLPEFTSLDLTKCAALKNLWISNDNLETLITAGAANLQKMEIKSGALAHADVSQNAKLEKLVLQCPRLAELNVDENRALSWLEICSDQLAAVRVENNTELTYLSVMAGNLRMLDVGENLKLTSLTADSDKLEALDVGNNKELRYLHVGSGLIIDLNLKTNVKLDELSLRCRKLSSLSLFSEKELHYLTVEKTPLMPLQLPKLTGLYRLYIYGNTGLKKLVLPELPKLADFRIIDTKKLSVLDLSKNTQIKFLQVENTSLTSINLSMLRKIVTLDVVGNVKLTKLDLSKNKLLYLLKITGNKKLTKLDLSKHNRLGSVEVYDNALKTLKFSKEPSFAYLDCSKNKLASIDLSNANYLEEVVCDKKVKVKGYKGKITRV